MDEQRTGSHLCEGCKTAARPPHRLKASTQAHASLLLLHLLCCTSAAEEAREAERRAREGDAYRTPEQRAEAARAARAEAAAAAGAGEEEARVLEGRRFDPARDYYAVLNLSR